MRLMPNLLQVHQLVVDLSCCLFVGRMSNQPGKAFGCPFVFSIFFCLSRRCPLLATFLSVLFCLLSLLISERIFGLIWFGSVYVCVSVCVCVCARVSFLFLEGVDSPAFPPVRFLVCSAQNAPPPFNRCLLCFIAGWRLQTVASTLTRNTRVGRKISVLG